MHGLQPGIQVQVPKFLRLIKVLSSENITETGVIYLETPIEVLTAKLPDQWALKGASSSLLP